MKTVDKFANLWRDALPVGFLQQLDRAFVRVGEEFAPWAVATSYTFTPADKVDSLQVNATSGNLIVYLPISPTGNRRRRVIKTDASANTVTLNGNGSLINGAATQVLAAQYSYITVEPTGTGWLIVT